MWGLLGQLLTLKMTIAEFEGAGRPRAAFLARPAMGDRGIVGRNLLLWSSHKQRYCRTCSAGQQRAAPQLAAFLIKLSALLYNFSRRPGSCDHTTSPAP